MKTLNYRFIILNIILVSLSTYLDWEDFSSLGGWLEKQVSFIIELIFFNIAILLVLLINKAKIRKVFLFFIFIVYFTIFIIQLLSVDMTGNTLNLVSLMNVDQAVILLNPVIIYKIIFLIFLTGVLYFYFTTGKSIKIKSGLFYILGMLFIYLGILQYKNSSYYNNNIQGFSPFKQFVQVLNLYNKKKIKIEILSKEDIVVAHKFNIHLNLKKDKPFQKNYIYTTPLAFKKLVDKKPNIIILFIESLSARLLSPYRNSFKNITPNIQNFAEKSMLVKGYYNHATPTAPGLYGQNCSIYPTLTFQDMDASPNILNPFKLKCMANFIADDGYSTFYFSHTRGHYTHFDENFKKWGYDNIVLWRDFTKKYLNTDNLILGEAGPSDHQMMKGLVNFLKVNDIDKPFQISLSTIESHVGRTTNPIDGIKYADGKSETLNLIHNFDDSFKIFWDYFKNSKYKDNTIVILTGDHSLYPNTDYKKVAGSDWIPSVYDDLALIIYDPVNKLPKEYTVNSTSIDLAPTVLHLLGIKPQQKNSFLGTSLFDKRENNRSFGLSAYEDFNFYINNEGNITNKKIVNVTNSTVQREYKSLRNVINYVYTLQNENKF